MIRRQLSNYILTSIGSNRYKCYFKFILILAGDNNLKLGSITMTKNNNMWTDLPFRKSFC